MTVILHQTFTLKVKRNRILFCGVQNVGGGVIPNRRKDERRLWRVMIHEVWWMIVILFYWLQARRGGHVTLSDWRYNWGNHRFLQILGRRYKVTKPDWHCVFIRSNLRMKLSPRANLALNRFILLNQPILVLQPCLKRVLKDRQKGLIVICSGWWTWLQEEAVLFKMVQVRLMEEVWSYRG